MFQVVLHYKSCTCGQSPDCGYQCAALKKRVYFASDEKPLAGVAFDKLKNDISRNVVYLDQQSKTRIHAVGKECTLQNDDFVDYFESPFELHDTLV